MPTLAGIALVLFVLIMAAGGIGCIYLLKILFMAASEDIPRDVGDLHCGTPRKSVEPNPSSKTQPNKTQGDSPR